MRRPSIVRSDSRDTRKSDFMAFREIVHVVNLSRGNKIRKRRASMSQPKTMLSSDDRFSARNFLTDRRGS